MEAGCSVLPLLASSFWWADLASRSCAGSWGTTGKNRISYPDVWCSSSDSTVTDQFTIAKSPIHHSYQVHYIPKYNEIYEKKTPKIHKVDFIFLNSLFHYSFFNSRSEYVPSWLNSWSVLFSSDDFWLLMLLAVPWVPWRWFQTHLRCSNICKPSIEKKNTVSTELCAM